MEATKSRRELTRADLGGGEAAAAARALLDVQRRLAAATAHDVRLVVAHAKALRSLRLCDNNTGSAAG